MGEFFEKIADKLRFERFSNAFRDHEGLIMTKGLRLIAIGCLVISLAYGIIAYIQFSRM